MKTTAERPEHLLPDLAACLDRLADVLQAAELDPSIAARVRGELEGAQAHVDALRRAAPPEADPHLSLALEAGAMGTWVWHVATSRVVWSPALEKLHGLEVGEFPGTFEAYQRDIHDDDREHVLSTIHETLKRRADHRVQYRIVRPDGETRWLEARGKVVCGPDGEPVRVLGVCADITDRKRAEDAVRETESWLATTLSSIGDAVIATDARGRVRYVNAVAANLIGMEPEAAAGRPLEEVFRIVHEQTRETVENPVEKALRLGEIVGLANHTMLIRPDGSEIAIDDSAAPIRNEQGEVLGVVLVFRDVTERRQEEIRDAFIAEATTLLASSLDYDATISSIVNLAVPRVSDWCAVDVVDEDGEIRRVGVAHVDPDKVELALEMARRWPPDPEAELSLPSILKSGKTVWVPEIPDALLESVTQGPEHLAVARSLGLRSFVVAPMRARGHALGAVTFVSAESRRRFDANDVRVAEELAGVAAIALLNAKLHRQTEEALERTALAHTRAAALQKVTATLAGALSVEDVAEAAVKLAQDVARARATVMYVGGPREYRLAAHRGLPASVEERWGVLPLDAPLPLARAIGTGEPVWLDRTELLEAYPHLAKSPVPAEDLQATVALPLRVGDTILGGLAFSFGEARRFDEDEREFLLSMGRQFALALERISLLEGLRRTVRFSEMFVGILGHDLRNPLSSILNGAEILRRTVEDDAVAKPVSRIRGSAERMTRMIEQLLDFTRIRVGQGIPMKPRALDCRELAQRLVAELEAAHGGTVAVEIGGDTVVHWDADRVNQLISNLVTNALQHREPGTPVQLRIDGTDTDEVSIRVCNHGLIPEALLPRLFEPLAARVDGDAQGSHGLGLGLYISQEVAAAHGGRIEVHSTPPDGTTFTVHLPRRAQPGTKPAFGT